MKTKTQMVRFPFRPKLIWLVAVVGMLNFGSQATVQQEFSVLRMGDKGNWSFICGPWHEDSQGIFTPPARPADENLAFYTARAFQISKQSLSFDGIFKVRIRGSYSEHKTLATITWSIFPAPDNSSGRHISGPPFPRLMNQAG